MGSHLLVVFGSGNGHFYHIEVTELPFHRIPFVSCFISLIDNTKKNDHFIDKNYTENCTMIFEVLNFASGNT